MELDTGDLKLDYVRFRSGSGCFVLFSGLLISEYNVLLNLSVALSCVANTYVMPTGNQTEMPPLFTFFI